nr:MAG TPA: hypothetical protein [Caudoviricetes sp.]
MKSLRQLIPIIDIVRKRNLVMEEKMVQTNVAEKGILDDFVLGRPFTC